MASKKRRIVTGPDERYYVSALGDFVLVHREYRLNGRRPWVVDPSAGLAVPRRCVPDLINALSAPPSSTDHREPR